MECPYCHIKFKAMVANAKADIRTVTAPVVCQQCSIVSLLENGTVRKLAQPEMDELKQSPAWEFIQNAIEAIFPKLKQEVNREQCQKPNSNQQTQDPPLTK
jgi:hypothetical protein